jgi:hypothetical protein
MARSMAGRAGYPSGGTGPRLAMHCAVRIAETSPTGTDVLGPGCGCVRGCLAAGGHPSWPTPSIGGLCMRTAMTRTVFASSTTVHACTSNSAARTAPVPGPFWPSTGRRGDSSLPRPRQGRLRPRRQPTPSPSCSTAEGLTRQQGREGERILCHQSAASPQPVRRWSATQPNPAITASCVQRRVRRSTGIVDERHDQSDTGELCPACSPTRPSPAAQGGSRVPRLPAHAGQRAGSSVDRGEPGRAALPGGTGRTAAPRAHPLIGVLREAPPPPDSRGDGHLRLLRTRPPVESHPRARRHAGGLHLPDLRRLGRRTDAAGEARVSTRPALPAPFALVPGLCRCGCWGGGYRRRSVTEPASTPGVRICTACAASATLRPRGSRPSG